MARTVKDAAYILQAIVGPDPNDNYTSAIPWASNSSSVDVPDYVGACTFHALQGKRIGVPRNAIGVRTPATAPIYDAFEAALEVLRDAGAVIVDNANYTTYEEFLNSSGEETVLFGDFGPNLAAYLSQLTTNPNNITSLEDIRHFTQSVPLEEYPSRDTANFDFALALNYTNTSPEFWAGYQSNLRLAGEGGILGALANYSLDAVVVPTRVASSVSAVIGAPVVTVPLGALPPNASVTLNRRGNLNATAPNMPFGISFAAEHFSEEKLIGIAYAFEQRTNVRLKVKPYLKPGIELIDVLGG